MLFRSLSLLLPVSLAFADTLVSHSDIDALKDVFKSAAGTMLEIQGACPEFADCVDIHHATVVTDALMALDSQVRDCTTLSPDHVISDTDGKWTCDSYTADVTSTTELMEAIIACKGDFQVVYFNSHVCSSLQKLATDRPLFHKRFAATIPAAYKVCIEGYYHATAKEKERLVEAFCGKE